MSNDVCVVFLCDKAYFNKFIYTCSQLITNGKQVEQIMTYIKKNRETKTSMEIKRVYNAKPGAGGAGGAGGANADDSSDEEEA